MMVDMGDAGSQTDMKEIMKQLKELGGGQTMKENKCTRCLQGDEGQTGEYPCSLCGRPTLWDDSCLGLA